MNIGSPSGAVFAMKRSRSSLTVGSAFSHSISDALVCFRKTCASPVCTPLSATACWTSRVMSTVPRPGVRTSMVV